MKLIATLALIVAATAPLSLYNATPAGADEPMDVSADETRPATTGPADTFTGQVTVKPLFDPNPVRNTGAAEVTFTPGARTAWHTHPGGQTLIVTTGIGWIQQWGGQKLSIKPGDVIWTPPGVKHWHGASDTSAMTHIAIQDSVDGRPVDWLEHVTDEQYRG
ncbi:MAG TPA: cupin domain-containing protein [Mycobacterium sp.]|nr:cupin domain-containing protein [Mycobacterium sp.]